MRNTIVSLITPPLKGAIAVIRISGDEALSIGNSIFSKEIKEPNHVYYGNIVSNGETIDQVLLTYFKGPKSFTGEDIIEISCHGSMLIANQIISLVISLGARLAERGEFSSRAFLNNKIDLVQAEAINSLINANTIESQKLALYSLEGKTSSLLQPLIDSLAEILANIEVNIDYPEYQDIEEMTLERVISDCDNNIRTINSLLNKSKKSLYFVKGIKIAIVGVPNAGKSSLLNAFLNKEKAIVTNIPGTTRDVVEGEVNIGGLPLHILDTAGIRESSNEIEKIGIKKSKESIDEADLIIMVRDVTNQNEKEEQEIISLIKNKNVIYVYNKKDLIENVDESKIYISALNKDIEVLKKAILERFDLTPNDIAPSLCSTREIGLLSKALNDLKKAKSDAEQQISLDLVSISIKEAYDSLKEIIGETVNVDLSKEIFSRFCVGK